MARARKNKKDDAKRKKESERFVNIRTRGGDRTFDLRNNPLMAMVHKGRLTHPQLAAAQMFRDDYEAAGYAHLRSPDIGERVDASRMPKLNLIALDAQKQIRELKNYMRNHESFELVEAVVAMGISFSEIHAAGGDENVVLSRMLKRALDRVAIFYGLQIEVPLTRNQIAMQRLLNNAVKRVGERVLIQKMGSPTLDQAIDEHRRVKGGNASCGRGDA